MLLIMIFVHNTVFNDDHFMPGIVKIFLQKMSEAIFNVLMAAFIVSYINE